MKFYTINDFQNAISKDNLKNILDDVFVKLNKDNVNNYFISFTKDIAYNQISNSNSSKLLNNVIFSLKDNVCTKGHLTTGACKILDKFIPDYDAEVYSKLKDAGAILVGKNNLDELGMGGTGLSTFYGGVVNPWNKERICGGSSSGSACSVAIGQVPFSIGTDTGDSVRKPACYCGIHGFKPTWNRISKYGVIPYTPSLDTLGILANSVEDIARVYEVISGPDKKDATCSHFEKELLFTKKLYKQNIKGKKILIIKEINDELKKHEEEYNAFHKCIDHLKNKGAEIHYLNLGLDILKALLPVYNAISYAESTSCQSYLQGIILGNPNTKHNNWEEILSDARKQFTTNIKLRQILGAFFLLEQNRDIFFEKSKKIRRLICYKCKELFSKYDIIISPSTIAPLKKDSLVQTFTKNSYDLLSDHFLIANFFGSPSYSLPIEIINKMPYGIVLTTNQFQEGLCLSFASEIEAYANWETKREMQLKYHHEK